MLPIMKKKEIKQMCFDISLSRCISNAAIFQIADEILMQLMFERGLVPMPVGVLLQDEFARRKNQNESSTSIMTVADVKRKANSLKAQQFSVNYLELQSTLREVFRTRNNSLFKEISFLFGGNLLSIKEICHIKLPQCRQAEGFSYEPLSDKEILDVSRQVFCQIGQLELKKLGVCNVYTMLKARCGTFLPNFSLRENDNFSHRIQAVITVNISHMNCSNAVTVDKLLSAVAKVDIIDEGEISQDSNDVENVVDNSVCLECYKYVSGFTPIT